jgi:hypothetical protein
MTNSPIRSSHITISEQLDPSEDFSPEVMDLAALDRHFKLLSIDDAGFTDPERMFIEQISPDSSLNQELILNELADQFSRHGEHLKIASYPETGATEDRQDEDPDAAGFSEILGFCGIFLVDFSQYGEGGFSIGPFLRLEAAEQAMEYVIGNFFP